MQKKYVIYKVTNLVNQKMYIGKTYNFEKRKREHLYDIDNELPFHKALKKYGLKSFKWEIIDTASTDEEIKEKEIYWIKRLNTCIHSPNSQGYNVTLGGEGGVSWNSRAVAQFDFDGNFIEEYISCSHASVTTGIHRKGIEECAKGLYKTSGGYRWKFKDEWDGKNIGKYKKKPSHRRKEIVQLSIDGNFIAKYTSVQEAAEKTKIRRTVISQCLTKAISRAGGYQWFYAHEYSESKSYKYKGIRIGNGIEQLDSNGTVINHFNNCAEAARSLGLPSSVHKQIHKNLDGKYKCHGYYWRKAKN